MAAFGYVGRKSGGWWLITAKSLLNNKFELKK